MVYTSRFSPSLIHGLCAFFASNSRFMRLFQAPLDTCLGSPFFASLSVHGLHFTVSAALKISLGFAFVMMLGMPKSQQQATLIQKQQQALLTIITDPEIFFRFRRPTQRQYRMLEFLPFISNSQQNHSKTICVM